MLASSGSRMEYGHAAKLPQWRYRLRQRLIPILRSETEPLALLQAKLRSPALDSYFAFTANLGTHTFFMVMLPILFWCGYTALGRAMVHLLALGVISSGIIKDLLCLPRPLSPPLQRITMSGSAALEYGFPSTHSTNAISVAVYALHVLREAAEGMDSTTNTTLKVLCYFYSVSIVFGRLYCGMHGFFDVVVGSILGALLAYVQIAFGAAFDDWLYSGTWTAPLLVCLIMLVVVRLHPEPADDCPCFDDSVAFAGVLIGIEAAGYSFAASDYSSSIPVPGTTPYSLADMGLAITIIRIAFGVLMIFAWRGTMKSILFTLLPPLFRRIEGVGADLPRKFFLKASEYNTLPAIKDDNVIPSASTIPKLINDVRQRRGRAVSIGPQSAADAYETIEYRKEQRRRSASREHGGRAQSSSRQILEGLEEEDSYFSPSRRRATSKDKARHPTAGLIPTPISSRAQSYEQVMGPNSIAVISPLTPPADRELKFSIHTPLPDFNALPTVSPIGHVLHRQVSMEPFPEYSEEAERKELFGRLEHVRVRYDVEVVTKLVVYAGIAWLAVEGNPVFFDWVGLGLNAK
ncbi:hypothetical protein FKW77_003134 [Venturia effusa]|uniref:Phosphatidic acid phosphatase type 2/haloperoxidase domain-containing protein n=1 Tax=Venturia effusa TaxID=50376 RepID=A0A517LC32_9PEZI|nr:hypothetical protein FKW77_003134 [Venturia effusa]